MKMKSIVAVHAIKAWTATILFVPFVIVAVVLTHLLFLHQIGSNNPLGLNKNTDKIPFHHYFTVKDIVGFTVTIIALTILTLKELYILRDPDKGHRRICSHHYSPNYLNPKRTIHSKRPRQRTS